MATLSVSSEAVSERIQAMRITAEQSISRVQAYVATNPQPLAKVVAAYRGIVANTGARIVQAQVRVIQARSTNPTDPTLIALERRTVELLTAWTAHARGYTAYERPATEAEKGGAIEVGVGPAVIIVVAIGAAVIAVSITGIAWAIVHYKEATILSDEVAIIEGNPALADALAKLNETAPSSAPSADLGSGFGWLLAALGLAGAAIFIVPKLRGG